MSAICHNRHVLLNKPTKVQSQRDLKSYGLGSFVGNSTALVGTSFKSTEDDPYATRMPSQQPPMVPPSQPSGPGFMAGGPYGAPPGGHGWAARFL
eukprot:5226619-Amphidinium_carterae.2